ncbi:hypothetical protein BLGI_4276 [Brevibacillus laterosporus GI-9]|nr:hypothetical protein BLGI_4276 [Brevibacillus laterosporus GI-9]
MLIMVPVNLNPFKKRKINLNFVSKNSPIATKIERFAFFDLADMI